jgi:hypothetical protein
MAIFLIVLGVFWPILTWHVCDAPLAAAIGVVLILWLLKFVFRTLPRMRWSRSGSPFSGAGEPPSERRPIDWKHPADASSLDAPVDAESVDDDAPGPKPSDDNRSVLDPSDDKPTDTDSTEGGKTDA